MQEFNWVEDDWWKQDENRYSNDKSITVSEKSEKEFTVTYKGEKERFRVIFRPKKFPIGFHAKY